MTDPSTKAFAAEAEEMESRLTEIARRKVTEMIEEAMVLAPRDARLHAVTLTASLFYLVDVASQGVGASGALTGENVSAMYRERLLVAVQAGFDRGVRFAQKPEEKSDA